MSATSDWFNSEAGQAVVKAATQIGTNYANTAIFNSTNSNTGINPYAGSTQNLGSLGGASGSSFDISSVSPWVWVVGAVALVGVAFALLTKKRR